LPSESEDSEFDEDIENEYLVSTYDVNQFQFDIKEDLFGLGYKRLDVGNLFNYENGENNKSKTSSNTIGESPAAALLFPMVDKNKNKANSKRSIAGHAFGVGEYEDEDDTDVYKQESIDSYDFELDGRRQQDTKKLLNKSYGFGAFDNFLSIMEKFKQSGKKQKPTSILNNESLKVPADFDLMHKFPDMPSLPTLSSMSTTSLVDSAAAAAEKIKEDSMNIYLKSATERSMLLGETCIKPDSVFDLLNSSDREFLKQQKSKLQLEQPKTKTTTANESHSKLEKANELIDKESKNKRYEMFVSYIKKNYKGE
jgi:hypothetical protein